MDNNKLAGLLSTLYSSTDNESIRESSRQLNEWQQTPEAWAQTHALLSTAGLQPEFYYFFAQTLKTKIQYDMYQLPADSYLSLRDSLMQKLITLLHNSVAKATMKQLSLAVADLSIQAIEVWTTAVPDLVNVLQNEHLTELLEILKLIPEETENLKLMVEAGKRNKSRNQCLHYYYSVLELLDSKFKANPSPEIVTGILDCFLSWIRFDSPPIQYSLVESPIFKYCLNQIDGLSASNLALSETVIEILTEVVKCNSSYRHENHHNALIETVIFPKIYQLAKLLLTVNLQEELESDFEALKSLVRLLVLTGEGTMQKLVASGDSSREFLFLLVQFLRVKNMDISEQVVPFWEEFLAASRCGENRVLLPIHEQLFEAIVERCDVASEPSFDGADPFNTIDSDYFFLRNSELLRLLFVLSRDFLGRPGGLEKLIRGLLCQTSPTLQEAFAVCVKDQLGGIVSDIPQSLLDCVSSLIDSLPGWTDVSSVHACSALEAFRRRGVLVLVGHLGGWLTSQAQVLRLIDLLAQVLIRPSVIHRSLHVAAAGSFKDLCFQSHARALLLSSNSGSTIQSVSNLFHQTIGHLGTKEHSHLTEGIVTVLVSQPEDALFVAVMRETIFGSLIASLASADAINAGTIVDRLTAVVRALGKLRAGSPRYTAVGETLSQLVWPRLAMCMEKFRSESEFIEKSCRLLKHSLRCVPDFFGGSLISIGQVLIRDFPLVQHSSYLYTAEVLAQEYGHEVHARPALTGLFDSLVSSGCQILRTRLSSAAAFGEDNVDELTEDLFGMMERFLRFAPSIVVKSQSLNSALALIVPVFARMKRGETIEAVCAFVEQIFAGDWTRTVDINTVSNEEVTVIKRSLTELAPLLTAQLFQLIVSVCGRAMRQSIPSLLMVMNSFNSELFRAQWVVHGLSQVPLSVMTDRDKTAAVESLTALDDERSVSNCVNEMLYRSELVGRRMRNETK